MILLVAIYILLGWILILIGTPWYGVLLFGILGAAFLLMGCLEGS